MFVEVLLSIYGETPFLNELLQSLRKQVNCSFHLIYRFDCPPLPEQVRMLQQFPGSTGLSGHEHAGVVKSYQTLLNASSADYVMFADQDDIWHPDKIFRTMEMMQDMEQQFGKNTPILIHTDLQVVDWKGKKIAPSLWKFQALDPRKNRLQDLMIQNNVTGCTIMLNRALADLSDTFPPDVICYDWYLAMIASAFGKIAYLDQPSVDYRQHSNNVYGAVPRRNFITKRWKRQQLHERIVLTQKQARTFRDQYQKKLAAEQLELLDVWSNKIPSENYVGRLFTALRYQFRKNDWLRTLGMWWAL